jgi:hypothetical protein
MATGTVKSVIDNETYTWWHIAEYQIELFRAVPLAE